MAIGFSPKLPVRIDSVDGFCRLNKSLGEVTKQNIKMVVLTTPGERMMYPKFGAGARNYLFGTSAEVYEGLNKKIQDQISLYVPYVTIKSIEVIPLNTDDVAGVKTIDSSTQHLGIRIVYFIPNLNINDSVEMSIFNN